MAKFETVIADKYTGERAIIRSNDHYTLRQKASSRAEAWERREQRRRITTKRDNARRSKEAAIEEAEQRSREAANLNESYRSILRSALDQDCLLDWESLKDHSAFKAFVPHEALNKVPFFESVPQKSFWEFLLPFLKTKRESASMAAEKAFSDATAKFTSEEKQRKDVFDRERQSFLSDQKKRNDEVDTLHSQFDGGDPKAVGTYFELVFAQAKNPQGIEPSHDVSYIRDRRTLLVDTDLPPPDSFSKILEVKFVQSKGEFTEKEMKKGDFTELYEDSISQLAIRAIREVFTADTKPHVDFVVFNGYVEGTDPKTGNSVRNCIVSIQAERDYFKSLNLSKVAARECLKGLKGVVASELINLAPVRPILQLDRNDKRIIEAKNVMEGLDESTNLATMDWELFEHLVRDLFEKEFAGDGVEVKVTQASRDAGVDAIIFDPDPIKGGKFVIQCKRYNSVVGVSAVRDLYGTIMNEGAVKGILVTTSHFGKDSIEFAKDKPITLLSGSELLFLFNKHGHNFKIELTKGQWVPKPHKDSA